MQPFIDTSLSACFIVTELAVWLLGASRYCEGCQKQNLVAAPWLDFQIQRISHPSASRIQTSPLKMAFVSFYLKMSSFLTKGMELWTIGTLNTVKDAGTPVTQAGALIKEEGNRSRLPKWRELLSPRLLKRYEAVFVSYEWRSVKG